MEINNCPSCGGKVEFSPTDKALRCVKCEKVYPIESKQTVVKKPIPSSSDDKGFEEWEKGSRSYKCANCGATIIINDLELTNKCQYCNTYSLVSIDSLPGLKPDIVLPFRISKQSAVQIFKENLKNKHFLPKGFKKNLPKADLGATYVSSFSVACNCSARYDGTRTVTNTYYRDGKTITETHEQSISGWKFHEFKNIVVEASDKISQTDMNMILPYNFGDGYDYDSSYIKGYSLSYYNKSLDEAVKEAKQIAETTMYNLIESDYSNVSSLTVYPTFNDIKYNYVLLPIYFFKYKYKEKTYTNLINGQNGKIGGSVPRSPAKIAGLVVPLVLLAIGLPLLVILITSLL